MIRRSLFPYKRSWISRSILSCQESSTTLPPIGANYSKNYPQIYKQSIENPNMFWDKAKELLTWFTKPTQNLAGSFRNGDIRAFEQGKLNACFNCVDRHLPIKANDIALIWEADDPTDGRSFTYEAVLLEVCKIANMMKSYGVRKGDVVTVYMTMTPEIVFTMLACARIGAVHSVVFAGFSAESLRKRLTDGNSRYVS